MPIAGLGDDAPLAVLMCRFAGDRTFASALRARVRRLLASPVEAARQRRRPADRGVHRRRPGSIQRLVFPP